MKYFSALLFSLFLLFSGCQKAEDENPCASVYCQNGGYCNYNGGCDCPFPFYGPNCENEMNTFTIDSIVVQYHTLYGPYGGLVEGAGEGHPDLALEMLYESTQNSYTTIHTSAVNNEVPVSTKSTFYPNWTFSTGAYSTEHQLILKDYDGLPTASYDLIREVEFYFRDIVAPGNQRIESTDGQFAATMYYSYQ
jgi:hypothetical protein